VNKTESENANLSNVPEEYRFFIDIFCKNQFRKLSKHCLCDLSIQLKGNNYLSLGPIYSLFILELQTLWEFIDKNLKIRFIRSLQFPCGLLVLFIKKKNRSLQLYVNYQGLNKITKKNYYLILLVMDLLDVPKKVKASSKINLCSVYYLI